MSMSSSSHLDCNKKRKRSGEKRVFKFKTFGQTGYPLQFQAFSFSHNVKNLLQLGQFNTNMCTTGMPAWSFQLELHRHPPLHVFLFVVEEPIELSLTRYCRHCQYVGWGHHLICNTKYHFLLPSKETMVAVAAACLDCKGYSETGATPKGKSLSNLMELQGQHIMHGVFHSNGFGHLLCVNGIDSGFDLPGHQIMEFWDRLCTGLRARRVSLNDSSQKNEMELRLLHGVAYGDSWFGRWGYKFIRGCYGVTQPIYFKAIEAIQGIPLCLIVHHLSNSNPEIPAIFTRYQTLSDHSLVTLGDLFHFMLELKSRLPKESCIDSYNPGILVETSCRWSPKRVEMAVRVIVEALKRAEYRWVARQEVRDVARNYIGDTGLLDFVLKSLGNHIVGNYLVRRSLNPVTKVLEYCLEDLSSVFPSNQEGLIRNNSKLKARYKISGAQLMRDVLYLYRVILKDQNQMMFTGILSAIPVASRIILDTKYFLKEYYAEFPSKFDIGGLEGKLKLYCSVMLKDKNITPFECVTLKNHSTFDDLKREVERNFRNLYWGLKNFVAESMVNLKINAKEKDLVFGVVEVGCKIVFQESENSNNLDKLIYENGDISHQVVDCPCGATEDDGERMICCDICEVWQHTRCVRIPNNEEIPNIYLCNRCEQEIVLLPSLP